MEMNIGDERNVGDSLANLFERNGRIVIGDGEPDDLATGPHHLLDLRDGRTNVRGVGLRHRLDRYGRTTADLDVLNVDWTRLAHSHCHYLAGARSEEHTSELQSQSNLV